MHKEISNMYRTQKIRKELNHKASKRPSSSPSAGRDPERHRGGEEGPRPAAGHSQQGHANRSGEAAGSAAGESQSGGRGAAAESSASSHRRTNSQQHTQGKASDSTALQGKSDLQIYS